MEMFWKTLSFYFLPSDCIPNSETKFNGITFLNAAEDDLSLKFLSFSKNPGDVSLKYTVLFSFFLKFSKFLNVSLVLSFFHLGMNFVPTDRILMVAKFGLKLFDRLCSPTGTIWFSNFHKDVKRTNMDIKGISLTGR